MALLGQIKKEFKWVKVNLDTNRVYNSRFLSITYEPVINQDQKYICFVIPGNPGNERFYDLFCHSLVCKIAQKTESFVQLYAISHLNHTPPLNHLQSSSLSKSRAKRVEEIEQKDMSFDLESQILHKVEFCKMMIKKMDSNFKIVLIGHSIGAYISIRARKCLILDGINISKCCCLFPAVEEIALTPNGIRIRRLIQLLVDNSGVVSSVLNLIQFFPQWFKKLIIMLFVGLEAHASILEASLEISDATVARNIYYMTHSEMHTVCEFKSEWLCDNPKNVYFYYGRRDGWSPIEHAIGMLARHPIPENVKIDAYDEVIDHAFVIRHSDAVADQVLEMICAS